MPYTWADGDSANATRLNGLPRGVMGYANGATSDQTGISSATDITSLSVTFTAIASRLYRTTVNVVLQQKTSGGAAHVYITDSTPTTKMDQFVTLVTDGYGAVTISYLETGISGSITRKARASTSAGTVNIIGSATTFGNIVVEDLGVA